MALRFLNAVTGLLIASAVSTAHAATISGSIAFFGTWTTSSGSIATSDVQDISIGFLGTASVGAVGGDYVTAGVLVGDTTLFQTLDLNPLNTPIDDYWAISGSTATFDLLAITSVSYAASSISVLGHGMLQLAGFDDTYGSWGFSGDDAGFILVFSAVNVAGPPPLVVPLPAALPLFSGIVGFFALLVWRKRRTIGFR